MTFEEWWIRQPKDATKPIAYRDVWESATKAEREECARLCESIQSSTGQLGPMAGYCAEQIRNRK